MFMTGDGPGVIKAKARYWSKITICDPVRVVLEWSIAITISYRTGPPWPRYATNNAEAN